MHYKISIQYAVEMWKFAYIVGANIQLSCSFLNTVFLAYFPYSWAMPAAFVPPAFGYVF